MVDRRILALVSLVLWPCLASAVPPKKVPAEPKEPAVEPAAVDPVQNTREVVLDDRSSGKVFGIHTSRNVLTTVEFPENLSGRPACGDCEDELGPQGDALYRLAVSGQGRYLTIRANAGAHRPRDEDTGTTILVRMEHATLTLYLEQGERSKADTRVVFSYPNRAADSEYLRVERAKIAAEYEARAETALTARFLRAFAEPHSCLAKSARVRNDDIVLEVREMCYFGREVIISFEIENRGSAPMEVGIGGLEQGRGQQARVPLAADGGERPAEHGGGGAAPRGRGAAQGALRDHARGERWEGQGGDARAPGILAGGDGGRGRGNLPDLERGRDRAGEGPWRELHRGARRSEGAGRDSEARSRDHPLRGLEEPRTGRDGGGVPGAAEGSRGFRAGGGAEVHPRRPGAGPKRPADVSHRGAARLLPASPGDRRGLRSRANRREALSRPRAHRRGEPASICAATAKREEAGRARVPEDFACYVMAHVAEALHYAHSQRGPEGEPLGIVHRDVSPSNIMVTRTGVPKLLDFGVAYARLRGRERTQAGMTRGTLTYMSPEQAEGRELDGRSDLFSLALLFVEMLTGRRVFDAGNDVATVQAVLRCDPSRVEEATSGLPGGLQRICRRALARSPAERYEDGEELARAILAYLRGLRPHYGARECAAELRRLGLMGEGVQKAGLPTRAIVVRPWRSRARLFLVSSLAVLSTGLLAGFLFVALSSRMKGPGEPFLGATGAPLTEPAGVAVVPDEKFVVKGSSPGPGEGEKGTGKGDEIAVPALGMTSEAAKGASPPCLGRSGARRWLFQGRNRPCRSRKR